MKTTTKKVAAIGGCAAAMIITSLTAAQAGTTWQNYNTTVGRINGNGYTGYQRKVESGTNPQLASDLVGGNYGVDARTEHSSGSGSWCRVYDFTDCSWTKYYSAGNDIRIRFSNDVTTVVAVQVVGTWRSN